MRVCAASSWCRRTSVCFNSVFKLSAVPLPDAMETEGPSAGGGNGGSYLGSYGEYSSRSNVSDLTSAPEPSAAEVSSSRMRLPMSSARSWSPVATARSFSRIMDARSSFRSGDLSLMADDRRRKLCHAGCSAPMERQVATILARTKEGTLGWSSTRATRYGFRSGADSGKPGSAGSVGAALPLAAPRTSAGCSCCCCSRLAATYWCSSRSSSRVLSVVVDSPLSKVTFSVNLAGTAPRGGVPCHSATAEVTSAFADRLMFDETT
mmetsp:Transcript_10671/g.30607  ORF Transcript_10671/g.30607 Transcript_10671/m.30607 type:complete len:264 (-) Transcript_10671:359-1150(-)